MGRHSNYSTADLKPGSHVCTPKGVMTLVGMPETLVCNYRRQCRLRVADAFGKLHFFFLNEVSLRKY